MVERGCPPLRPFWWEDDGLTFIDQRRLPTTVEHGRAVDVAAVVAAVDTGAVAGDRCAALFAAFGVVLARRTLSGAVLDTALERLRDALGSAARCAPLERVRSAAGAELAVAIELVEEERAVDRAIARSVAALLPARGALLTHGATGALATGGEGTAVGAIRAAHAAGAAFDVYVSESWPSRDGARLTAYELDWASVPQAVVPDAAIVALMRQTDLAAVIIGARSVAPNGDVVALLGTAAIVSAAAAHGVPVYVAAARRAFETDAGIEPDLWRPPPPATSATRLAQAEGTAAESGRDDLTPGRLISAFATEYGLSRPPYDESLMTLAQRPRFAALPMR